jgi:hypothetical protein
VIGNLRALGKKLVRRWQLRDLPHSARSQVLKDQQGLPQSAPSIEQCIAAGMDWLCLAQDKSRLGDAGVARVYSLVDGWSASYPETTGYIIPTFLHLAKCYERDDWKDRAHRMLAWLKHIQMPNGAFQGGQIDSAPVVPVAFNTGQILLGLAAGDLAFGGYRQCVITAADWLVSVQDEDGAWRNGSSPFALPGAYTYSTHIGWGLLEAARVTGEARYAEAALKNARWVLGLQKANGWLPNCCLSSPNEPLTHTIGYALRGLLEAYRYNPTADLLRGITKLAIGVLSAQAEDGSLPGQLRSDWSSAATWCCLTGNVQIAYNWFLLYQITNEQRYLDAGRLANLYVRRTIALEGAPALIGAVRGSFPVNGEYCRFQYPNWAAKFMVDSLVLEQDINAGLKRY